MKIDVRLSPMIAHDLLPPCSPSQRIPKLWMCEAATSSSDLPSGERRDEGRRSRGAVTRHQRSRHPASRDPRVAVQLFRAPDC